VPSSADVEAALTSGAAEIVRAARAWPHPVVLIDGRSGAGKSTIAAEVSRVLDAELLALDAVYPGWDGLASGVEQVREGVLSPLERGASGSWTGWDWANDRPAGEHTVQPRRPLVVEGSGILTPATRELSHVQVWVESPESSRRARALARDGETYRPHWMRWAAQEERHLRDHDPRALASIVIYVP
jgi:cytidylate kinase